MTNSHRLANVRACLLRWLADQKDESDQQAVAEQDILEFKSPIQRESILIRDEFFVGRRFHTEHHDAVWFIEEDELKVYHSDGQLACVFGSAEISAGAVPEQSEEPSVIRLPEPGEDGIRRAA